MESFKGDSKYKSQILKNTTYQWALKDITKYRNLGMSVYAIETKLLNEHGHSPSQITLSSFIRELEKEGKIWNVFRKGRIVNSEKRLAKVKKTAENGVKRDFQHTILYPLLKRLYEQYKKDKNSREGRNIYIMTRVNQLLKDAGYEYRCTIGVVASYLHRTK